MSVLREQDEDADDAEEDKGMPSRQEQSDVTESQVHLTETNENPAGQEHDDELAEYGLDRYDEEDIGSVLVMELFLLSSS